MIQLDLGQPETLLCRQVVEQPAEVVEVFLAALRRNASMIVDRLAEQHWPFSGLDGFWILQPQHITQIYRIDQIEETFENAQ